MKRLFQLVKPLWQDRWYVIILLGMLVYIEYVIFHIISSGYCQIPSCERWALIGCVVTGVLIWVFGWKHNHFHAPTTKLLGRFLDNSLKGNLVVLITVLVFLMQLTWFIDYMSESISYIDVLDTRDIGKYLFRALVPFVGMLITVFLFPYPDNPVPDIGNRSTMISSLSVTKGGNGYVISANNIDLITKPLKNDVFDSTKMNSTTLSIKKIYIIPSYEVLTAKICQKCANGNDKKLSDAIAQYNKHQAHLFDSDDAAKLSVEEKWSNLSPKDKEDAFVRLESIISSFVPKHDIKVKVVQPVDYNSFATVCERAQQLLKRYEDTTNDTLLYISPGTNISGSALAIMSIVGGRVILYQEQFIQDPKLIYVYPSVDTLSSWYKDLQKDADAKMT